MCMGIVHRSSPEHIATDMLKMIASLPLYSHHCKLLVERGFQIEIYSTANRREYCFLVSN